jgi:hypothetical protein
MTIRIDRRKFLTGTAAVAGAFLFPMLYAYGIQS